MISFAVTAKLICVFVFAHAKSRFSHAAAQFIFHLQICTSVFLDKAVADIYLSKEWDLRAIFNSITAIFLASIEFTCCEHFRDFLYKQQRYDSCKHDMFFT